MKEYGFEKLDAWSKALDLSLGIYEITKLFPESEKFGLISQMRRCAVSVQSNIAEGSARITNKDRRNFYAIAFSSLMELLNQNRHFLSYFLNLLF